MGTGTTTQATRREFLAATAGAGALLMVRPAQATPATVPADAGGAPRGDSPAAASGAVLEVTAPLVGIFYRAPKPGAQPYVEVGAAVQPDSIIGIIEVMKLMNAVRAEVSGTVVEVLVQDGAVVEYGQVLARVAPGAPGG